MHTRMRENKREEKVKVQEKGEKIKEEQKITDKFGWILTVLGRTKKWKKQGTEGTIREVAGEESKYTVLKFKERVNFNSHRKAVRRLKTEKR